MPNKTNKYRIISESYQAIHPSHVIKLAQNGYKYVRSIPEFEMLVFSQKKLSTRQALQRANKEMGRYSDFELGA